MHKNCKEPGFDVESGDFRISIQTGSLFGFCRQAGDRIVAGESCFPLTESEACLLEEGVRANTPLDTLLGNHILILVVVDPPRRVVTIAHSIASWRPCYLLAGNGSVTISTTVRGLREAGHEIAWNHECTPEYLMYRFVVPSRSILRGVAKLAGGQLLVVDLENCRIREDRRWPWPDRGDADLERGIVNPLRSSVEEWFRRFPNVGVLLSGGVDSSLLAALARLLRPDVRTFSTSFSFANPEDGETQYALSMARHLHVDHEVYNTTPERYLVGWVESIDAAEEPVHHIQSVLLHLLFRDRDRSASACDAILSGEGADCLFGNASHAFLYRRRHAIALLRMTGIGSVLAPLVARSRWHGKRSLLFTRRYDRRLSSDRHFLWTLGRHGDPSIVRRLLACDEAALFGERLRLLQAYDDRSLLDQVTILSLLCEAHATITIWGKLAEASRVRLACPYTSSSVIASAAAVPWNVKLRESKHLARTALRQLGVPEKLIARPKLSFGFPSQFWARRGTLFQPVVDMAKSVHDGGFLESLQTGEDGAAMVLWCVLNQFLWTQLFEVGRSVGDLAGEILDRRRTLESSR
jgi:asparagine synthase (glutamine-hydrolysing)